MRVLIISNAEQEKEIRLKKTNSEVELIYKNDLKNSKDHDNFDAIFILSVKSDFIDFQNFGSKPVFINSVINTLAELQLSNSISRINAWPGFLEREIWEVASENKDEAQIIFNRLGWKAIFVKDEPGFVAARVISMIINEAFFAFNENVSTIEEIDLAMKLGTNYPFGPFEWADMIGLKNVFELLKKLSEKDPRYLPAASLENCIHKIKLEL